MIDIKSTIKLEEVSIYKIPIGKLCQHDFIEPISAKQLLHIGDKITVGMIDAIKAIKCKHVLIADTQEEKDEYYAITNYIVASVQKIVPGTLVVDDFYNETGVVIIRKNSRLTHDSIDVLKRLGISTIRIRKKMDTDYLSKVDRCIGRIQSERNKILVPATRLKPETLLPESYPLTVQGIEQLAVGLQRHVGFQVKTDPKNALQTTFHPHNFLVARTVTDKKVIQIIQSRLLEKADLLFRCIKESKTLDSTEISSLCDSIIRGLIADREMLFASLKTDKVSEEDYFTRHALNSTIIACTIAATCGFSQEQVIELGYGTLLADVGMLKIPYDIRFKKSKLTERERLVVQNHISFGLEMLKQIKGVPRTTPIVVHQAHERIDGTGYPLQKKDEDIHDFAKIAAIASTYNAMIDSRPYRDKPMLPYEAMYELLQGTSTSKYDRKYIRGLLTSISLFPIGSWVKLNTGEVAQVLAAHPSQFTKPVVAILLDRNGKPTSSALRVDLANPNTKQKIMEVIEPPDMDAMVGF